MIFDDFCELNKCIHYRVWEYSDGEGQPYTCFSCDMVGQSYHVEMIPDGCPYHNKSGDDYYRRLAEAAGKYLDFCHENMTAEEKWKAIELYQKYQKILHEREGRE